MCLLTKDFPVFQDRGDKNSTSGVSSHPGLEKQDLRETGNTEIDLQREFSLETVSQTKPLKDYEPKLCLATSQCWAVGNEQNRIQVAPKGR